VNDVTVGWMTGMTYGITGPLKPAPLVPFQNKWMKKSEGELTNPHLPGKQPLKGRWISWWRCCTIILHCKQDQQHAL